MWVPFQWSEPGERKDIHWLPCRISPSARRERSQSSNGLPEQAHLINVISAFVFLPSPRKAWFNGEISDCAFSGCKLWNASNGGNSNWFSKHHSSDANLSVRWETSLLHPSASPKEEGLFFLCYPSCFCEGMTITHQTLHWSLVGFVGNVELTKGKLHPF